jgi:cytosine/adenosine deaminase-related metal-dependent hydrolase
VGALADLVTVRLDGPRLAGTSAPHALDAVVFAGTASDVETVIVGGRELVRAGVHVSIDVADELATAIGALQ